jgi:hypothetical protein
VSNTLNAYPTDLASPCQILLTKFGATPAPVNEQIHAVYQLLGIAAGNLYPDGAAPIPTPTPVPIKDIWDRPDGMKSCPRPSDEECKKALEEGCRMRGKIGDFFNSPAGKVILQLVLSMLPALLVGL